MGKTCRDFSRARTAMICVCVFCLLATGCKKKDSAAGKKFYSPETFFAALAEAGISIGQKSRTDPSSIFPGCIEGYHLYLDSLDGWIEFYHFKDAASAKKAFPGSQYKLGGNEAYIIKVEIKGNLALFIYEKHPQWKSVYKAWQTMQYTQNPTSVGLGDVEEAKVNLPRARKEWQSSDMTPPDYAVAAFDIIWNMEYEEKKWLTLGNIVQALGPPTEFSHHGYASFMGDDDDSEEPPLTIYYEKQKVGLRFSAAGFADMVLHEESSHQDGSGVLNAESPSHWPQKYSDAEKLPIVSKTFENREAVVSLMGAAEDLIRNNPTEDHWRKLASGSIRTADSDSVKSDFSGRIMLVDGISEDVAKVHFEISGLRKLYCDTWWLFKEGVWETIAHEEAEGMVTGDGDASQKQ